MGRQFAGMVEFIVVSSAMMGPPIINAMNRTFGSATRATRVSGWSMTSSMGSTQLPAAATPQYKITRVGTDRIRAHGISRWGFLATEP